MEAACRIRPGPEAVQAKDFLFVPDAAKEVSAI